MLRYLSFSLLAHSLFLLAFISWMQPSSRTLNEHPFVASQLVTQPVTTTPMQQDSQAIVKKSSKQPMAVSATQTAVSTSKPEPSSELLALLHAAIQRQQQYPGSAQELQQEGTVTLAFTLSPDGSISNLRVARSSGTESLDSAALSAVRAAVPFQQIDRFLRSPQEYNIDVIFKLEM